MLGRTGFTGSSTLGSRLTRGTDFVVMMRARQMPRISFRSRTLTCYLPLSVGRAERFTK
jgi:hypothetical protein